jgi:hypothetical protein
MVEGAAMDASGRFTLVGAGLADGLAPPLGGAVAVFQLTCTAAPVPDLDQFPAVTAKHLAGHVNTRGLRLHTTLSAGSLTPDFTGPALVRVTANGGAMAEVDLPQGLTARGRRTFVGSSGDGAQTLVVRLRRRRPSPTYALALRVDADQGDLPGGRPVVTLTSQVGGLLTRVTRVFRANRAGTRLRAP